MDISISISVSIPIERMKNPTEAWYLSGGRAITVIGCWFKKEDGLAHTILKRKKDGKTWEEDLNFSDQQWTAK